MADVLRDRLNQMAEGEKCNIAVIRQEFEKLDVHVEAEDGLILFKHRSDEAATDPLIKIFTGKIKDIKPVMWVIFALFAIRIITLIAA